MQNVPPAPFAQSSYKGRIFCEYAVICITAYTAYSVLIYVKKELFLSPNYVTYTAVTARRLEAATAALDYNSQYSLTGQRSHNGF